MKNTLMIAAVLGGIYVLARKLRDGSQPIPSPPLASLENWNRLADDLEAAFWHGDTRKWEETSKKCRDARIPGLPDEMRRRLTKRLGRDNLSE